MPNTPDQSKAGRGLRRASCLLGCLLLASLAACGGATGGGDPASQTRVAELAVFATVTRVAELSLLATLSAPIGQPATPIPAPTLPPPTRAATTPTRSAPAAATSVLAPPPAPTPTAAPPLAPSVAPSGAPSAAPPGGTPRPVATPAATPVSFATWGQPGEAGRFRTTLDPATGEIALTVLAQRTQQSLFAPNLPRVGRFTLEVEARATSEAGAEPFWYGLAFLGQIPGPQAAQKPHYLFQVSTSRTFRVLIVNPDGSTQAVQPETSNAAILGEGQPNRLTVTCRDGTITVGANGTTLGVYNDPDINPGEFGIAVAATIPGGATAVFRDLRVAVVP